MAIKYYYEDLAATLADDVGSRLITRDDILRFAREFDPQPFHVDEEAAKKSVYGGLIASGWMTCSVVMRLMCDHYLLESASLGSPGNRFRALAVNRCAGRHHLGGAQDRGRAKIRE
ncbi:MAG: MaoC/PaaZ C-terminal domain-containing protein [Rhodospirillales bacterium]